LDIVLSVLRFTDSDYTFGICKLLFHQVRSTPKYEVQDESVLSSNA